jgi:geranylgeranyl pyrophosphate synthase
LNKKEVYEPQLKVSGEFLDDTSGKRVRSILFYIFSDTPKLTEKHHETIALIESIHNASIMHDDVVDANDTRRGKDSMLKNCGSKMSVLTGDFLIVKAMKRFFELYRNDMYVRRCFLRECYSTAYGALIEQNLNRSNTLPSIQDYLRMASIKTSPLFKLSCQLGAHLSEKSFEECKKAAIFGVCFGLIFQAQNDLDSYNVCNCLSSEDYIQKNITLPIIILCRDFGFSLTNFRNNIEQKYFNNIKQAIQSESFLQIFSTSLKKYDDWICRSMSGYLI